MKTLQKGFTLIELMIVVAIIGILAAIAIPAYQDYTIRSQVTEGLNLADAVKTSVAEYYAANGIWPVNMLNPSATGGLGYSADPSGKYVSDITVLSGAINITYQSAAPQQANANIAGGKLSLVPKLSPNNDVIWICGNHTVLGVDPATGPAPVNATNAVMKDKYLPQNCRA